MTDTDTTVQNDTAGKNDNADAAPGDQHPLPVDNRASYTAFAFAFVFGHGAFAVSTGPDPLLELPGWLPFVLLGLGIVPGVILALIAAKLAQFGADEASVAREKLVGTAWGTVFIALTMAISGMTSTMEMSADAQAVLWPTGAVFVVGMINIAEGAIRRNTLHYSLGSWLTLVGAGALFFSGAGALGVLAVAGGGAYALAAYLERRRLAKLR
ncbi:hypothetical protein FHR81_000624 [Actinoalloteichus hoggarensis]|uniref:Uncharacterized protein n=1 Tax=Actinoalloteichus hoggarensis TaxID=1470176 RepID=A0A221W1R7_9PSEU|nr:ABC transporter permease [Actinoalloteichus hoggarensis]ASO19698.1 hypothetical protein AHOG_10275 [Actinoalloteichus hoggarensis]MBB5919595.1 hypothetical protein [Actinoalloteichus hoggarensis]